MEEVISSKENEGKNKTHTNKRNWFKLHAFFWSIDSSSDIFNAFEMQLFSLSFTLQTKMNFMIIIQGFDDKQVGHDGSIRKYRFVLDQ